MARAHIREVCILSFELELKFGFRESFGVSYSYFSM